MKTKNIIAILAALPIVAGFSGCKSDEVTDAKPAKEMLIVEGGNTVTLNTGDESGQITITADCGWKIQNETILPMNADSPEDVAFANELNVQPHQGNGSRTMTVSCAQNQGVQPREAYFILVSDGGLQQRIKISQKSGDANMSISERTMEFSAVPGAAQQLVITSNMGWTIDVPTGIDWLHLSKNAGSAGTETVNVTLDEIQTDAARSTTFTILYGSSSARVTVRQEGKGLISLDINPYELPAFSAQGGEQLIQVTSNASWRAFVPSSARSWLRVEPASGVGNGQVRVFCEPNRQSDRDRMSLLIIVAGSNNPVQQDILIQQSAGSGGGVTPDTIPQQVYVSTSQLQLFDEEMLQYGEAMLGFEFRAEGGTVGDYGLCYCPATTSRTPTVSHQVVRVSSGGREGFVEGRLNNLQMGVTYCVRGYVRTSSQVFYTPNVVTFTPEQKASEPSEDDNPDPTLSRKM